MRALLLFFTMLILSMPCLDAVRASAPQNAPGQQPLRLSVPYAAHVTVPQQALLAQGWSGATLTHLRVRRQGQLIASSVDSAGLHFTAEANDSPFSSTSAYWLSVESTLSNDEIAHLPAQDQPLSWAPDTLYSPIAHAVEQDGWFAAELRTDSEPLEVALTLSADLAAGSTLILELAALIDTEHSLVLALNGIPAQPLSWQSDLLRAHRYTIATPQTLPAGPLSIEIALASREEDTILLKSLSLPDARLPLPHLSVTQLEPAQQFAPGNIDTLILAPAPFLPTLQPLVAAHESLGEHTALIDVQAAYDRYSFGERDPQAIRTLIRNWQPRPQRVILVGDGSLRMRDQLEGPDLSIPPYIVNADPKNGAVPCDTCYVRLDSDNPLDDPLPDLAIGRLPVHTQAEAALLVDKTVNALLNPPAGSWSSKALLIVDNDQDELGFADPAGPFTPLAEHAASLLSARHVRHFAYAPGQPSTVGRYATAAALRQDLFPAWNAGAGLLIYVGHASPWQWAWTSAQEATPHLFHIYDADLLNNAGRLPILFSLSCQSGNSFQPDLQSSDERLLLRAEGGISAALSPTGSAVIRGHSSLADGVLPALNRGENLGQAHLQGIASLIQSGRDIDLAFSYNLLGDPDVRLPQPHDALVYLPGVQR